MSCSLQALFHELELATLHCRHLVDRLHSVTLAHICREENEVADRLAKESCNKAPTTKPIVFDAPPDFVSATLQLDRAGAIRYRKTTEQTLDMETTLFAAHDDGHATTTTIGVTIVENSIGSNDQTFFGTYICPHHHCNSQLPSSTNTMHTKHRPLCSNSFI